MEYGIVRWVCVWLGVAWVDEGEWRRGLSLGFTNPVGAVAWLRWCRLGVGRWLGPGFGGVVLCLCELELSV